MLIRVLIATDSREECRRLAGLIESSDVESLTVTRKRDLWSRLQRGDVDLVLIHRDFIPPPVGEWIRSARRLPERPELIVVWDKEDARERASLLAAGALAVLNRQLADPTLSEILLAFTKRLGREARAQLLRQGPGARSSLEDFVSASVAMQQFMDVARKVVASESSVLIMGETGSGKERLAQAIHNEGPRAERSFLAINCGALPESLLESELFGHEQGAFTGATRTRRGYFELAHKGTLFLDEIGEMPLHLQVKLLRVLEDRQIYRVGGERAIPVDVRIMAASNRLLEEEVEARRFRPDLFFRLAVVTLSIPALRERREDIPQLVESYLGHFNTLLGRQIGGVTEAAMEALILYDWPGNVRELINVMERAVLLCAGNEIGLDNLADAIRDSAQGGVDSPETGAAAEQPELPAGELTRRKLPELRAEALDALDRRYLLAILEETEGRVGEAAARAGLSSRSLYNLMQRHGLDKADFKRE